jgi:hypothetical protein
VPNFIAYRAHGAGTKNAVTEQGEHCEQEDRKAAE